ncbi:TlpA family protein disulfide reductase [Bdellovibrio sp. SKB1291214]|uniref:TlpA family protein disulfide reductase n=1 Tax=Bdellovibrio sp. SKB1291214 TaxID=1732569 RepID=UPI000B515E3B|nr:TlpA disulfide reductase family protein [Bdellovibrio sp. SKB1291214]UYL08929.1 TlpA family protein disulfide reductase [Bdellovibrio sp. SKB1291214]
MKQHLKALALVIIVGALGYWAFNHYMLSRVSESPSNLTSIEKMETEGVPNFTAKSLDGQSFDLNQMKGKVVILNFWASWCGPCVEEVPSLIKLIKEYKGDIQLIAVSGDSNEQDIHVFLKSFPELKAENIKIVYDQDRSLMKMFDVSRLPESLVLNKEQKLVKKLVGSIDWHTKDSVEYMDTLLGKKK